MPPSTDRHCPTWAYYSAPPTDLITWAQAEAAIAPSPHPMSARSLRRRFIAAGGRVYHAPGRRGELISRSALYDWHRAYWNRWTVIKPPTGRPRGRRPASVR